MAAARLPVYFVSNVEAVREGDSEASLSAALLFKICILYVNWGHAIVTELLLA